MRPNSSPITSSRESLDPDASLPDDDEANGESSTHCCDSGDTDVDERIKRHCRLGTMEIDNDRGRSVELINLDDCIVCETSDNQVSRCSGNDCLLSFHRECLYADLGSNSSEHLENPYCPYCWLKLLALKSNSLRAKAIGAKNAVCRYLGEEMKSRDEDTTLSGDENGYNQEHSIDRATENFQQGRDEDTTLSSDENGYNQEHSMDRATENFQQGRDEDTTLSSDENGYNQEHSMVRATENFQEGEDNETAQDQNEVSKGAGNKGDVSLFLSMQESCSGKEQDQGKQNEKQRRLTEFERNGEDVTEQITSLAQVTSSSGRMKNQQRQLTATTKLVVANPNTVRVRDIYLFKEQQKRKQFWTLEEEEMLKMGVEKFAAEGKKNMPWKKILEMGEKVFHETRTPSNLKDKWRSMVAKGH